MAYLQPVELGQVGDPKEHVLASGSDSPVRAALQRRSDLAFIDTLDGHIRQEGIDAEVAAQLTAAVLCEPSIKVKRATEKGHELLQSVLVRRVAGWGDLAVTATFHAADSAGGLIRTMTATVDVVDLEDVSDQLHLVQRVEECLQAYPFPHSPASPVDIPSWALLGDLMHHVPDCPPGWESRIQAAGDAYGRRPDLTKSPDHYKLRHIEQSTEWLVGLQGVPWVDALAADTTTPAVHVIGSHARDYAALEAEIRVELLTKARTRPEPTRQRALARDEIVYHRKVGNGRKFDRFDDGSSEPCSHGATSFEPFTKAPKATKGMQHRYTNFKPSMLVHCRRYPNCNVYGVDESRG